MKLKKILRTTLLLIVLPLSVSTQADPAEEASMVFEEFLTALTNTDVDSVLKLFSADALFWGTGSPALVTDNAGIRQYFSAVGANPPGVNIAQARDYSVAEISDSLVLISGMWEVVQAGASDDSGTPLRVSMAVALRDGQWKIIQFHNSAVPE